MKKKQDIFKVIWCWLKEDDLTQQVLSGLLIGAIFLFCSWFFLNQWGNM